MDSPARKIHGSEKRQRSAVPARMRLTPDERAELNTAAERAGMSVGSFMRHQCLGTAGPRAARRPPIERTLLAKLLAELAKCGSNVNQIARILNSGGNIPTDIAETMAELRTAGAAISRALGRAER